MYDTVSVLCYPSEQEWENYQNRMVDKHGCKRSNYKGFIEGVYCRLGFVEGQKTITFKFSIPKLARGDNWDALKLQKAFDVIQSLKTQFPCFSQGQVIRADWGSLVPLEYPAYNYLRHLGPHKRMKASYSYFRRFMNGKQEFQQTRGYAIKNRSFIVYDKIGESIEHDGLKVPAGYIGPYFLRVELQIKRRLRQQLNITDRPIIHPDDLFDPIILNKINDYWYHHYTSIIKINRGLPSVTVKSVQEIKYIAFAMAFDYEAEDILESLFEQAIKKGFPRNTVASSRARLMSKYKTIMENATCETLEEINDKMASTYKQYKKAISDFAPYKTINMIEKEEEPDDDSDDNDDLFSIEDHEMDDEDMDDDEYEDDDFDDDDGSPIHSIF